MLERGSCSITYDKRYHQPNRRQKQTLLRNFVVEYCWKVVFVHCTRKTAKNWLPEFIQTPSAASHQKDQWYDFLIVTTSRQMQSNSLLIAFIDRPLSNPFALVSMKDVCMPQHFSAFFFSLLLNHVFKDSTEGICLVWRKDQSSMFGIPWKDKVTNTETTSHLHHPQTKTSVLSWPCHKNGLWTHPKDLLYGELKIALCVKETWRTLAWKAKGEQVI